MVQKQRNYLLHKNNDYYFLPKGNNPPPPPPTLLKKKTISLPNTVYKIGSATIANTFKSVRDKLINDHHTGFICGRYIWENTY